jgi:hypothetical protein
MPHESEASVLSSLGVGGNHVLVVVADDVRYGLHVCEVLGVRRFHDDEIGPPPKGQASGLIAAMLYENRRASSTSTTTKATPPATAPSRSSLAVSKLSFARTTWSDAGAEKNS